MFHKMDKETSLKIVNLVLPYYDPDLGQAGHIEELVLDFRVHLRQVHELKTSGDQTNDTSKPEIPLFTILLKCLCRLQKFDKCFEILVLSFYFILQPTIERIPDKTTVQSVKYIVSQLHLVLDQSFKKSDAFSSLLDYCCFACRDFILQHYHSFKLLHRITRFLTPLHTVRFVGKILQDCHDMDLRNKSKQAMVSVVLCALQQLNRNFMASMLSTSRLIDSSLAKSLSNPIAHFLKHQIEVAKYKPQARHLLYTSCTAFALLWYDIHKGEGAPCVDLVRLLHEMMTTGEGLQGLGVCSMECDGYSFLEVAKHMLKQSDEDIDDELAQCYNCLYGYGLLTTCQNHHGDDEKKRSMSKDNIMELFEFCQRTEAKLARRESSALFANVLELPDTKTILQSLVPVNDFQTKLSEYMNPVASYSVHTICPIECVVYDGDGENPLSVLWYDLAANFYLPKVKRRGRDYAQLFQFEIQCMKYIKYLRCDIFLHPGRAESYRLLAACLKSLRSLIVDHWVVAWQNHTYPEEQTPVDLASSPAITFEQIILRPFFKQFMEWIEAVQKAQDDETSQRDIIYRSREISLFYAQYVAILGELMLRCCDMAAKLDREISSGCYEDAGVLIWGIMPEKTHNVNDLCDLASKYFEMGLQQENIDDEAKLRLNYMLGKVAKKKIAKKMTNLNDWRHILEYFSIAEKHRQSGDLESLPHAFYQLHACRLKLLLGPVNKAGIIQARGDLDPSPELLQLVNSYYYFRKPSKQKCDTTPSDCNWTQESIRQLLIEKENLWNARQQLLFNCLDALESIPLDDRYFHPAYYSYAWGLQFGQVILENPSDCWKEKCSISNAIKAMKPLFDRKRPQVVAVWLSESDTHKLEELHQQQTKYDRLRLKYFSFYLNLMTLANDQQRVSDLTGWVLTSKEEHWVIDAMLLQALSANSYLARGRLLDLYLKCLFPSHDESNFQQKVFQYLNRMYGFYLEYNETWHRVRTSNEDTMGNWLWEVTMSYALYIVVHEQHIEWCDLAVGHVEKSLIQYSQSVATGQDALLNELYQELKMEEQSYWPTLVDEALNFCSLKWPDKTKPKTKTVVARSKLRFLSG
ncbi:Aste57867_8351 [Aphanomyces stellatus]|uniref:Aste57867_8351 protein n=1 Tax=Aphanomyces stellatus TaxID=120398 RepID=A0A485KK48_9STRA|nr:hypothetical protein As57867_008319 [Aphanomyces stellatus]VFT85237.1 Aste57867_8351 [Aphanomyces stellatus]